MEKKSKHTILFLLLFFCFISVGARRFSSTLFFVYDTQHTKETKAEIVSNIGSLNTGLYLSLFYNMEREQVELNSNDTTRTLEWYSELLIDALQSSEDRIIPIFISYNGPTEALLQFLDEKGLVEHCFSQPNGEKWPQIDEIVLSKKRIVIFCFDRTSIENPILHYAWDFIADLPFSGLTHPKFSGFYSHGRMENELLLVRDFIGPNQKENSLRISVKPYYLNYLLDSWIITGKYPTFVFTKYSSSKLGTLYDAITSYKPFYVEVKALNVPLKKVMWNNEQRSITNGNFCLPYSEGEKIKLSAHCPGYNFKDSKLIISDCDIYSEKALLIEAIPYNLVSGLSAYFNFEGSISNLMLPDKPIKIENCSVVSDRQRGNVLKAGSSSSIKIGDGDHFGIRNNSFTVSSWIKLNEDVADHDYSILGTKAYRFREGLHLVIRKNRPYFGLFGNDYKVNYEFERKKWYHLVFRYDITNGEQTIFINGVKKGASLGHPSFIGMDELTLCSSLGNRNPLYGYLDDFCIWRRPLGEDEILQLYTTGVPVDFKPPVNFLHYLIAFLFTCVLLFLIIRRYYQKKDKSVPISKIHSFDSRYQYESDVQDRKIQIKLFGEFEIFDANRNEIGNELSKQLSKIFILLLFQQTNDNPLLKIDRLTNCFWPDSEQKKATNSRNVAITKLRKFLDKHGIAEIVYRNNGLELNLSSVVSVDLLELELLRNKNNGTINIEDIQHVIYLIEGGKLLRNYNDTWLEPIKFNYSNGIIELCEVYLSTQKGTNNFVLFIAERLLIEDEFNFIGFTAKIQSLYLQGQLNKVKQDYSKFITTYEALYGEIFPISLEDTIKVTDYSQLDFTHQVQI